MLNKKYTIDDSTIELIRNIRNKIMNNVNVFHIEWSWQLTILTR